MPEQIHVLVAMPVYNEAKSIGPLLEKLASCQANSGLRLSILFVDDGSSDDSLALLHKFADNRPGVTVLTHGRNKGLGAAVNTILTYALAHLGGDDVLVTLDGDDTHDPALITKMIKRLQQGHLDLVVASRFAPGAKEIGVTAWRRLLSRGASMFFRLFSPLPHIKDYSSGYRAYRVALLQRATAHWGQLVTVTGFECMAEIMMKLSRLRPTPRAGEVGLVLGYDRKQSPSKMQVVRTVWGYFKLLRTVSARAS